MCSLGTLPPELYFAILSHVPHSHLQLSTLNLSRAIPLSPVPLRPLFEHISVSRQEQLPQLYRRLRYPLKGLRNTGTHFLDESTWVKSFSVLTWQVDADVLLNILAILPGLESLSIRIGPVFTPEHLQDMFKEPKISLNMLDLRFRPYVKTASYYQFLKGSYFDSTFDLISSWPSNSSLTFLSIVQDPLPRLPEFAQPIVFFSLTPLTRLSLSPATQKVTHVRLRVPSRRLISFLASKPGDILKCRFPFPSATFMDLSTSSITNFGDLELLLNFIGDGQLRYLVIDYTGLCDGSARDWEMLGRTCALAGVKHSREYEKTLKSRMQADVMAAANDNQDDINIGAPGNRQDRPTRRGRRGLATATISLRDRPTAPIISTPLPLRFPDTPHRSTKIRICPSPPRLLSLCINPPLPSGHSTETIRAHEVNALTDFLRGWSEGIGQLRSIWTRLRQSQANGVKVYRFDIEGRNGSSEDMLDGLVQMCESNNELWEELESLEPPSLCFSGPRGESYVGNEWSRHPNKCGHRISWDVWGDNL